MAIPIVLPNVSVKASVERFSEDILELESKIQVKMAGEMEKLKLETLYNYFKLHANSEIIYQEIIQSEGFAKKRNVIVHNNAQT